MPRRVDNGRKLVAGEQPVASWLDRRHAEGVSFWTLVLIGLVTAFVTVLLTDLTAGWSWLVGPLAAIGIVVVSGLRKTRNSKTFLVDAGTLILILSITLPIALAALIFFVWAF